MHPNAADVTVMKVCYRCGELKPLSSFYWHKSNADGHYGYCKVCKNSLTKAWRLDNPEKANAAYRKRRLAHPEKYRAAERKWRQTNPEKVCAKVNRRKSAKLSAAPKWSETELIKIVYEKAGVMGFQVDHVVPLQSKDVCGLHVWSNLQLLSQPENRKKGNRHWPDMWEQPA